MNSKRNHHQSRKTIDMKDIVTIKKRANNRKKAEQKTIPHKTQQQKSEQSN